MRRCAAFPIILVVAACLASGQGLPEWQGRDSSFGFKPYSWWTCVGGLSFKWGEAAPGAGRDGCSRGTGQGRESAQRPTSATAR